jgi:hypothetical protein
MSGNKKECAPVTSIPVTKMAAEAEVGMLVFRSWMLDVLEIEVEVEIEQWRG